MTKLEAFKEKEPELVKALEKAILKAAQECPQGLVEWLGMSAPVPLEALDPADEEFMKTISGM